MQPLAVAKRKGQSVIEIALMCPWIFLLFIGVVDFGFYSYALISVQNAARVGAMYTSSGNSASVACANALEEIRFAPGVGTGVNCACAGNSCTAGPATFTVRPLDGQNGNPFGVDGDRASEVTISYVTPQLIPIPGLLPGRMTIARTVQMRMSS